MDQDDNTARGHRSPAVRSTAPAGTPYPVAPNPPPAVPAPSASQPRTVGGHTARLVISEDDALDFDPLAPSSNPEPLPSHPYGGAPLSEMGEAPNHAAPPVSIGEAPAVSSTMGGTQRLQQVSPEEAALAQDQVAREEADKKKNDGRRLPAPTVDMEALPAPLAPAAVVAPPGDEGSSFLARLFAPVSVAVGLVFFAMGSMLTLTVEGRLIRFTVTLPADTVSLPSSAPSATVQAGGGAPSGPTHTAAHPPSSVAPPSTTATSGGTAPAVSTGKPPGTARPQGGTGKRPPIIF